MAELGLADIRGDGQGYHAYHAPRFRYLLELIDRYLPGQGGRILDIGPSPLTELLRQRAPCAVETLGLEPEGHFGPGHRHIHFDLNTLRDPRTPRPTLPRYDLIVLAEVLEHLYTAPRPVLRFLHEALKEGGILLLQTPNAASLPKRIKLLLGRNPYDPIREAPGNPGHFREYTLPELRRLVAESGFAVLEDSRRFYFDARFAHHEGDVARPQPVVGTLKNLLYRALPGFLREGVTLVLRAGAATPQTEPGGWGGGQNNTPPHR